MTTSKTLSVNTNSNNSKTTYSCEVKGDELIITRKTETVFNLKELKETLNETCTRKNWKTSVNALFNAGNIAGEYNDKQNNIIGALKDLDIFEDEQLTGPYKRFKKDYINNGQQILIDLLK